jgi:hypothetical protein
MTNPSDPIEDWLGTDVELLPPRPGTFEQIHRRARHRKAAVALSAGAGVAVLIVAAATLPQFLPNQGGGPSKVVPENSRTSTPQPSRHRSPKPRHTPGTTHTATTPPTGSNLSITTSTVPATAGIAPSSVTFVTGSVGAVIGETTSGCASGCEAVAGTNNYGRTWVKVDPPPAGPPNGDSGVSQIRFLNSNDGWAFGPALYVTHNGGATWAKVTGLPGRVIDLATVGGSAYAVVASCTGTGSDYAGGCTSFALYSSAYNADSFQAVPGASGAAQAVPGGLQLTNQGEGYLLAEHHLFTGSPSGGPWQAVTAITGLVPACLDSKGHQPPNSERGLIAPGSGSQLYLICQTQASGKSGGPSPVLYQSANAGQAWKLDGKINSYGAATSIAVAPYTGAIVVATDSTIIYSTNGRAWHQASFTGPVPTGGFSFVGMTTANGVALAADAQSKLIYITTNGGRTWQSEPIS